MGIERDVLHVIIGAVVTAVALSYIQTKNRRSEPGHVLPGGWKSKGKISYNDTVILGQGQSIVYDGLFEDQIPVAVKKIVNLDKAQTTELSKNLDSVEQSLRLTQQREIDINQSQTESGHPNLVRYFGFEVIENGKVTMLLALERCHGTLADFISKRTAFPQLLDRDIFWQIASGLDHLHGRKIVHRDLKPSNIMIKTCLKDTPQVKIADFGLSKFLPDDTSESALSFVCGTKGWMAPELSQRHSNDEVGDELFHFKSCDVYALGLIFFYIASDGKRPLNEDGTGKITSEIAQIKNDYTLFDLLTKMTAEEPTNRCKTGKVLKHPALWTAKKTLSFLSEVSDWLQKKQAPRDLEDPTVINSDWRKHLPPNVIGDLFIQPAKNRGGAKYYPTEVRSLLRAIRNYKHHFSETQINVQRELGDKDELMLRFWTSRYNRLIIHTYNTMKPFLAQMSEFEHYY